MPTQILMPALSPTMEEGTLAKWHVKEGDEVNSGDVIAEIETDKAVMEVEAVDEGRLGRILVKEGTEGVKVNTPIAVIIDDGEDANSIEEVKPVSPSKTESVSDSTETKTVSEPKPQSTKPIVVTFV